MSTYSLHIPLSMQFGYDDHAISKFLERDCPNKSKPKGPKNIGKTGMRDMIQRPGPVIRRDPVEFMRQREEGLV